LQVDPKTVRRWLEGRIPYLRYRWALSAMLGLDETDLWPQLRRNGSRPGEVPDLRKFVMVKATTCGNVIDVFAVTC